MIKDNLYPKVKNDYLMGMSVLALSHKYNTNTGDINSILKKGNIKKISQAKRLNPDLIEDYFEKIDSQEKAYWLGWILTDGGVTNKSGLEISLKQEDTYILELLQQDLGINNHIRNYNNQYSRFSFVSKKILKDLEQYGVVPNKSLTLKYPKNIAEEYECSLLRGMFEGDGGISYGIATRYYKDRNKSYTKPYRELSFTGTYDMCKSFHDVLMKYASFQPKNICKNHSVYRVRWSNINEIISIFHVLYDNCENHYLKRKYNKLKEIEGSVTN
jgi:hypothetical protein